MTDPIDKQAAEFNRLRAKRLASQGPTNSAAASKPAKTMGFHARRAAHRATISTRQLEASKARVAEAQAALEARRELAEKQRQAREAKAKLASAQAALANRAKLPAVPPAAKPAATATKPAGTVTAVEFAKPPLVMSRPEFAKLSPTEKARFIREGGKITD